jgi:outer membrane protein OmpA-like peptidoglycan-associated protein
VRRLLLAIFLAAGAASPPLGQPCAAQENVAGGAQDLQFTVSGLTFPPASALLFPVQDTAAKSEKLQVKETNTEIRISLSADILFDFDKSNILHKAAKALKNVAAMIRDHPGATVRIEGYTDAKGSDAYNRRLSERRAISVRNWLITKEGLTGIKFATRGFGAKNPVAPNTHPDGSDNPEGRQKNRRVEIVIRKG